MADPMKGKYHLKRHFGAEFEKARTRLAPLGGQLAPGVHDYEAFTFTMPGLGLIFYPHKTTAGHRHIRVRSLPNSDLRLVHRAIVALKKDEHSHTFDYPMDTGLVYRSAAEVSALAQQQPRKPARAAARPEPTLPARSGRIVPCDYCHRPARFVSGREVYPHRADLAGKAFYRCDPCDAHVGCHPGGDRPMGRLANAELRQAKQAAHAVFDPLWLRGGMTRGQAYAWLAGELAIPQEQCHIGMFDVPQCQAVVAACRARYSAQGVLAPKPGLVASAEPAPWEQPAEQPTGGA